MDIFNKFPTNVSLLKALLFPPGRSLPASVKILFICVFSLPETYRLPLTSLASRDFLHICTYSIPVLHSESVTFRHMYLQTRFHCLSLRVSHVRT